MSSDTDLEVSKKLQLEQLKNDIVCYATQESVEQEDVAARCKADEAIAHLKGLRDFYKLRTDWSHFILGCIAALLTFHIILTTLVGLNILNYEKYPWFLPTVVTEHLIQIIGLAIIVVKFLFSEKNK